MAYRSPHRVHPDHLYELVSRACSEVIVAEPERYAQWPLK